MRAEDLIQKGYEIVNGKITDVSLNFKDHGCLTFWLTVGGCGWGVSIGGYCLGKGYLYALDFKGSEYGIEALMRVMDCIGIEDLYDAKGKYVRVAQKGLGESVEWFGNILDDKWFSFKDFFVTKGELDKAFK